MDTAWYTTRERVRAESDQQVTARWADSVDRAIASVSDSVNRLCRRYGFAPYLATRVTDFPELVPTGRRLYLGQHSLISLTAASAGSTALTVADLLLYPLDGPPYEWVEPDPDTSASFSSGSGRYASVSLTGRWGHSDDRQAPAGTLTAGVNDTVTTWPVSVGALTAGVGTGSIVTCGTEMATVTGLGWSSTGQTVQTPLTASVSDRGLVVTDGTAFTAGERLMVDTETVQVTDVAGNTLVVARAVDSSVLATHAGSTVYAKRSLTVSRASRGSTAASHSNGAALTVWVPPPLVEELTVAESLILLGQRRRAYTPAVPKRAGAGGGATTPPPGGDVADLRARVVAAYGRPVMYGAV